MPTKRKVRSSGRQKEKETAGWTVSLLPVNLGGTRKKKKKGEVVSQESSRSGPRRVMEEESSDEGEEILKNATDKHQEMRRKFLRGGLDAGNSNNSENDESDDNENSEQAEGDEGRNYNKGTRIGNTEVNQLSDNGDEDEGSIKEPLVSNDDSAAADVTAQVSLCFYAK
jgi:hypothetical protein